MHHLFREGEEVSIKDGDGENCFLASHLMHWKTPSVGTIKQHRTLFCVHCSLTLLEKKYKTAHTLASMKSRRRLTGIEICVGSIIIISIPRWLSQWPKGHRVGYLVSGVPLIYKLCSLVLEASEFPITHSTVTLRFGLPLGRRVKARALLVFQQRSGFCHWHHSL